MVKIFGMYLNLKIQIVMILIKMKLKRVNGIKKKIDGWKWSVFTPILLALVEEF